MQVVSRKKFIENGVKIIVSDQELMQVFLIK